MDEHIVYVLYSNHFDRLYCGVTSDLIDRFRSHNSLATKGWTRSYRPWIVIHVEVYMTRSEALRRENVIKSGKGREWIRKHVLPNYM